MAAPLALGFLPRLHVPAVVLEIVLGIALGPSGLGWVAPDQPVSILALVGLAFLLFLSGLEIDVARLRGAILRVTALGFAASFAIAVVLGFGLRAGGFVKSPPFVAIVLVATSLGVIVPVLKDSGNIRSNCGQLVIAAASIADFGAIILLSLFFSGERSTSTVGTLILLGIFGLVVVVVGLAIVGIEHWRPLSRILQRLQDTTAQIRVLAAFVLLIGFTALADPVGLEHRRTGPAVPPCDRRREGTAGAGLRPAHRTRAGRHRGRAAGHLTALHRRRHPDRPAGRRHHPRQRRRSGGRGPAVGGDLSGARAGSAPA